MRAQTGVCHACCRQPRRGACCAIRMHAWAALCCPLPASWGTRCQTSTSRCPASLACLSTPTSSVSATTARLLVQITVCRKLLEAFGGPVLLHHAPAACYATCAGASSCRRRAFHRHGAQRHIRGAVPLAITAAASVHCHHRLDWGAVHFARVCRQPIGEGVDSNISTIVMELPACQFHSQE
jgi:hypothetical protein